MSFWRICGLWMAALLCCAASLTQAQAAPAKQLDSAKRLSVGVYISPPFVMEAEDGGKNGEYSGMAIELWQSIAGRKNLQYTYSAFPSLAELVQATERGTIDIAVTNLTVTQDRAERMDFTHPWFDAGLRILVDKDQTSGFWDVFNGLQSSGHLRGYAWLASMILLATLLFTLFDRRFDKDFPLSWREGVAESFYTVMSVATSGKMYRKNLFGWLGRIGQALWLVCGIAVLSYITASVTSVMTSLSLTSQIHSLRDLAGKNVGVIAGSVAESSMQRRGIGTRDYSGIEEAVAALRRGEVQAVVGDAPVLAYYAYSNPQVPVLVVGPIFEPDKYGFGLPKKSALTRTLSVEIIGAYESGEVEALRKKYFGSAGR